MFTYRESRFGSHLDACAARAHDLITRDGALPATAALAPDVAAQVAAFGLGMVCGGPVTPAGARAAVLAARAEVLAGEVHRVLGGGDVPDLLVAVAGLDRACVEIPGQAAVLVDVRAAARRLARVRDGAGEAAALRALRGGWLAWLRGWLGW